ncbi:MAG TPA: flagellar export protein FliJ [Longimicrobiaceae bacterium]|nr:flagellar export protein FliJ [Longimicrobiaceae bacterium]
MFKFRLQRVLELRLRKEQSEAQRLADAQREEDSARAACEALARQRDAGARSAADAQTGRATAGQLQNLRFVVDQMSAHVERAQQAQDVAHEAVELRRADFTAAFRDRRVLDRLRERHLEDWRVEEVQLDRQLMDGIALSRFVRAPEQETEPGAEEKA